MTAPGAPADGAVVLLAAGRSRRFGADKRRHVMADGRTLLEQSLTLYGRAFPHCLLVLRLDDPEPALTLELNGRVEIVRARDADHGMGHSLAAGVRAAAGRRYVFVALADMPWVTTTTLATLRTTMEDALTATSDVIVQPVYAGTPGHPVGFAGRCLATLETLTGDRGARFALAAHAAYLRPVPVQDAGVLRDLDRPLTPEP